ncbi:MAG: zinc-binding dehydrogenase [Planctomycetota bacterium]
MGIRSRAIAFVEREKAEVVDVRLPDVGPGDILVRTDYSGVSAGTDGWIWQGKFEGVQYPLLAGYQKTGVVVEAGKKVRGFGAGDRVYDCTTKLAAGEKYNVMWGGHTEYSVIGAPDDRLFKLPKEADLAESSLCVLLGTPLHGIDFIGGIRKGETVLVMGLGLVGQGACQGARLCGARVIAADLAEMRVRKAKRYSADIAVTATPEALERAVRKAKKEGVDVLIDTTGSAKALAVAIPLVRLHGRVSLQGYYPGLTPIDLFPPHAKELVFYCPCDCDPPGALRRGVRLMAQRKLNFRSLITHRERPESCQQVYEMLKDRPSEALAVVFKWR